MSFLDSVLSSIETGKPSPIPKSSSILSPPITSANAKAEVRKPNPPSRPVSSERKNGVTLGAKRKAEEPLPRPKKPELQASSKPLPTRAAPPSAISKPRTAPTPIISKLSSRPSSNPSKPAPAPSKPSKAPIKGSYQDLMMRAKAVQDKAPTQVGMFKHQSAPKEKLSKVERKKRIMEAQTKEKDPKPAKKAGVGSAASSNAKPGSVKAMGKREPELSYKGTGRPAPAPAPASAQPEYRGTSGLASRFGPGDRRSQFRSNKRSRMNEYLGTDEEDEGEYADEYDDYYSESSDMEAGLGDMEQEEAVALASARREDEEELRAELVAKQEKLERRKRLGILADRKR